jgi:hypothetical protein
MLLNSRLEQEAAMEQIEGSPRGLSPPLIILIHGTWAHGLLRSVLSHASYANRFLWQKPRIWNDCPGDFERRLAEKIEIEVRIKGFSWTGYNSVQARYEAACALSETVADEFRRGTRQVFIVAHSHGGNVAEYASAMLEPQLRVSGIVTMACPFISASPRNMTQGEESMRGGLWLLIVLAVFGAISYSFFALASTWLLLSINEPQKVPVIVLLSIITAAFVTAGLFKLLGVLWRGAFSTFRNRWASQLASGSSAAAIPFLSIRATGDEAHAALMLAQVLNSLQQLSARLSGLVCTRAEAALYERLKESSVFRTFYYAGFVIGTATVYLASKDGAVSALIFFLGWCCLPLVFDFSAKLLIIVLGLCVVPASRFLAALASYPFGGFRLILLSVWMDFQVETGPTDKTFEGLFLSKNSLDDLRLGMRHRIYDMAETTATIGKWIRLRIEIEEVKKRQKAQSSR